jgi:lipid II:glycine glycyltransferase (peptidoglycan interpeptide bridge formation enzyme)
LDYEIQIVRKKTDEITKEKQQLENNMQFFSNADESNPMIKKILKTIDRYKSDLEIWEAKLRFLRTLNV